MMQEMEMKGRDSLTKDEAVLKELETSGELANEAAIANFKKREAKVLMKLDIYIAPLLGLFNFIVCILQHLSAIRLTNHSHTWSARTLGSPTSKGW